MRGQIWSEILLVVMGAALGAFLVVSPFMERVNSTLPARTAPILSLIEVNLEHSELIPFTVTVFVEDNGWLLLEAFPSSERIAEELNKYAKVKAR